MEDQRAYEVRGTKLSVKDGTVMWGDQQVGEDGISFEKDDKIKTARCRGSFGSLPRLDRPSPDLVGELFLLS